MVVRLVFRDPSKPDCSFIILYLLYCLYSSALVTCVMCPFVSFEYESTMKQYRTVQRGRGRGVFGAFRNVMFK